MMGNGEEWVMVRRPAEKDLWSSSLVEEGEGSRPLKITFAAPAPHWTDAIPIGNGRLGAMIWGGVASEILQLNEDTLWTGNPRDYVNPNAPEALEEVRKLVDNGHYADASTLASNKLTDVPPDTYQLIGDMKLEFDDSHKNYDQKTYQRELDLDTATATVKYSVGGVEYTREHFISHPDQVIVMKISASKPASLSFTVSFDSQMKHHSYVNAEKQIMLEGSCAGKRGGDADASPKGVQFFGILEVHVSGDKGVLDVVEEKKLKVEGADSAILHFVAASSFDGPFTRPEDSKRNPTSECLSALKNIRNLSYPELYGRHLDDYQEIFHRVSLKLSKSSKSVLNAADTVPTAERVKSFKDDEDPSLIELLFQFGRYLLIASSRPGTQVSNLQGVWNKDLYPPWDSAQHLNINLQMNYWGALTCNLSECQEPLFEYTSLLSVTGSKTAKVNYEVRGWLAHQVTDLWAKTSQDEGDAVWGMWPMGGAWICTHLWEHYTFTLDKDFLRNKAYPLLEGCTIFLLDWLLEGRGGYLKTNPSTSPEHKFYEADGKIASVSYSSTMDMSIIREIFSIMLSSAEILGKNDDELIQRVRQALPRLLPTRVARDGSILEWAEDFQDSEVHHRHISHLFGLYPGHTITPEKNPDLCKAADYTLYKRGEDGPGWSTIWKTCVWARLHNSEHAYRMVKHLFVLVDPQHESSFEGGLYSNLFTAHPPFQIDANLGFPAAIAEMLVQSTVEDVFLLPALPRDKWPSGSVKGLKARGGVTVNITWKEEKDMWNPRLSLTNSTDASNPLKISFSGPAKYWTDAIPIGNGRLGAMLWGGVTSELIQLNEDTLWTGTPSDFTNPAAPEALSEVRKLVDRGEFAEATDAASKLFGNSANVYQLLGDIKLEFDVSHAAYVEETYSRELDLDTATARVKYYVGDVEFTREYFASNPDQVIAIKISASKAGSLSFTVSLDSQLDFHSYISGGSQIVMEGSCPGNRIPPKVESNETPKGIQFAAVLDLQISDGAGVVVATKDKKLKVEGSDWAVVLLVASSSFEGPFIKPSESTKDPTFESLSEMKSIKNLLYSHLYTRHVDDYKNLFHRVSLQLLKSTNGAIQDGSLSTNNLVPSVNNFFLTSREDKIVSTAERIKSFQADEDPSLVELLFQFGRYLLISCSRPGTQVANLQGVWNKDLEPKWDSAPHLNINLEMNYWPSLPCNLNECQEPLFDFIKSLSVNGHKTADVNYKARGWVVHHKSDIWAKSSADTESPVWAIWPMGGAWLCTHLWEHYTYTMDKDFLINTAYPLLEGCASFLLDWLIEGKEGYLETNPSTSPEHTFIAPDGKSASVSYSSTMDMAIIREVFSAIVSASKVLDRSEDALIQKVLKAQPRLRPTKIAEDGSVMEWVQEFKDPEVHHRHLSPLFGLFPGHTISIERNPDLCKAAENTLYKRGEDGPGWSTTWKVSLWARLRNSENAYRMVKHLIKLVDPEREVAFEGGLYSNLFAAHPPFQIDANFGFTAAVAEMLVQSTLKDLYILPALPLKKWANGCVKGLKARGGLTVNICWKEGDLQEVGLWLKDGNSVHALHYKGETIIASLSSGIIYTFNGQLKCVKTCSLL
ncbi:hypothetical protein Tsubulata_013177 [Turnera subulata]|uniref:Glycosyl hydrolase family 95 N-terminal domain-containing protein n=1 Tax=Turnera subulata TaxID=218843 RepID=A0A9Q0JDQ6_9ROSI|nr:hypothetical protein Tsubulata_013177 [Turnera subulata]